jgi:hypothetical protein
MILLATCSKVEMEDNNMEVVDVDLNAETTTTGHPDVEMAECTSSTQSAVSVVEATISKETNHQTSETPKPPSDLSNASNLAKPEVMIETCPSTSHSNKVRCFCDRKLLYIIDLLNRASLLIKPSLPKKRKKQILNSFVENLHVLQNAI